MDEPNLSLDHAIALFTIFEGLALWKLPEFLQKGVQKIDFEGACKNIWDHFKDSTFSGKCYHTISFGIRTLIFKLLNCLSSILRWSPVFWGVAMPFLAFFFAARGNIAILYTHHSIAIYSLLFWFVVSKTVICVAAIISNWLYMKNYKACIQSKAPSESVLNANTFVIGK